jgi:hypothetical protein
VCVCVPKIDADTIFWKPNTFSTSTGHNIPTLSFCLMLFQTHVTVFNMSPCLYLPTKNNTVIFNNVKQVEHAYSLLPLSPISISALGHALLFVCPFSLWNVTSFFVKYSHIKQASEQISKLTTNKASMQTSKQTKTFSQNTIEFHYSVAVHL